MLTDFLQELENVKPERDTGDEWTWIDNLDNIFTVKSTYDDMLVPALGIGNSVINLGWLNAVPSKVNVFAWRILLDKVQTRDKLAKLNIIGNGEILDVLFVMLMWKLKIIYFSLVMWLMTFGVYAMIGWV